MKDELLNPFLDLPRALDDHGNSWQIANAAINSLPREVHSEFVNRLPEISLSRTELLSGKVKVIARHIVILWLGREEVV